MSQNGQQVRQGASKATIVIVGVVSVVIGLFLNGYDYKLVNWYLDYRYQIMNTTEHYANHPLDDLTFRIPVIYDSELRFPDFNESVNIQTHGRLELSERALVNIVFDIEKGEMEKYEQGTYPGDVMFMNVVLEEYNALYVNQQRPYCELFYSLETVDANDLPYFVTQLLVDNVFVEEFRLYYPGSFLKTVTGDSYVLETQNSLKNPLVEALLNGEKTDIDIGIYLVGHEFDIFSLIDKNILPWLRGLETLFNFRFRVHPLKSTLNEDEFKNDVDDVPSDLLRLPWISEIMSAPVASKYDLKIVHYPYNEGGDMIFNATVDGKPLYHSVENHDVRIPDKGLVYFTHISENGVVESVDDFLWILARAILDAMDAPSHELPLALRVASFKRVLIVDSLTRYGKLLGDLKWHLEKTNAIYDVELLETVSQTLKKRQTVLHLAESNNLDQSLELALELLKQMNSALEKSGITT